MDLPEEGRKQADRELGRLESLPPAAAEHGVIRTYLEWIASLPGNPSTEDNHDPAPARQLLDAAPNARGRRARRHPPLPGVDRLAAVEHVDRGQPRPRARPPDPRRGPLRPRT